MVGPQPAELAVEIGVPRGKRTRRRRNRGYLPVQSSPVRVSKRTSPRSSRACTR